MGAPCSGARITKTSDDRHTVYSHILLQTIRTRHYYLKVLVSKLLSCVTLSCNPKRTLSPLLLEGEGGESREMTHVEFWLPDSYRQGLLRTECRKSNPQLISSLGIPKEILASETMERGVFQNSNYFSKLAGPLFLVGFIILHRTAGSK